MSGYIDSLIATAADPFTMAVVTLLLLLVAALVVIVLLLYVVFNGVVKVVAGPTARRLCELKPGDVLIVQSREKGHDVTVRKVQLPEGDSMALDSGQIITSEDEVVTVPKSSLILIA
jgi:uncharacterized protein (DUF58 family)